MTEDDSFTLAESFPSFFLVVREELPELPMGSVGVRWGNL